MRNMAVLHSPAFSYPLPVLVRVLSNLLIFKGKILYYNKDTKNIQEPIFTPDYLKFIAIPDRIFHLSHSKHSHFFIQCIFVYSYRFTSSSNGLANTLLFL